MEKVAIKCWDVEFGQLDHFAFECRVDSHLVVSERGSDSQLLQCKTHVKEQFVDIDYGGVDDSIGLLMSA